MGRRRITFQLYEGTQAGAMRAEIIASRGGNSVNFGGSADDGGVVYVAKHGDAQKQAITDKDGTVLTNPRALTQGSCEFYVPDTISFVDLYIMAPGGQFTRVLNVDESLADIAVDVTDPKQMAIIPFSIADTTANVETDTGFDLPLNSAVLPWPLVRVSTADATEDIDVGILSTETNGDGDGFIDGALLTTAGLVKASLLAATETMGALLSVLDSANAGDDAPEPHVVTGANGRSVSYLLSAGTDTAEGFIYLPYWLCGA